MEAEMNRNIDSDSDLSDPDPPKSVQNGNEASESEPDPPADFVETDFDEDDQDQEFQSELRPGQRGTFLIQDLTPVDDDEEDVEGLTIGPFVLDSENNFEPQKKESDFLFKAEPEHFPLPLEVEVLVYTSVQQEAEVKSIEEDELSRRLAEQETDDFDPEKIKELKEKLAKVNVPTRNPYISSTTFDVRYQLDNAGAGAGQSTASPSIGNKIKRPSRWRRFLRGFHRRISFLLPSALKKDPKTKPRA